MNKELTSVEWLWEQIDNTFPYQNIKTSEVFNGLLEQAKKLHRQQIIDAWINGDARICESKSIPYAEDYYNETYNNVQQP